MVGGCEVDEIVAKDFASENTCYQRNGPRSCRACPAVSLPESTPPQLRAVLSLTWLLPRCSVTQLGRLTPAAAAMMSEMLWVSK